MNSPTPALNKNKGKPPIIVLISGRGSNLQAIIDGAQKGDLPVEIRAVVSNNAAAYGLERARQAGIECRILDHCRFSGREQYDRALMELIGSFTPKLVVLAGFMRVLTDALVRHYAGHIINIHPSLLPAFRGLDTHTRALKGKVDRHGASVHFVTEELDGGPVIIQASVPVRKNDTPETLAARVLKQEHRIYPLAIRWFVEDRLKIRGRRVMLDGAERPEQGLVHNPPKARATNPSS